MRIVPVFATFVEGAVGAEEEGKGETVALVLLGYMRQAGIDTPTINRIAYLRAVGCDIMLSGLGDLIVKTEMTPDVVVGFAELVVCEETTEGVVECADSLLKRCSIGIEEVFVFVQTICDSDRVCGFLVAWGIAA